MEDDAPPFLAGAQDPGNRDGAAGQLARESLGRYSRDELDRRVALLEAEIARVKAHAEAYEAHRLAAEQLFARKGP